MRLVNETREILVRERGGDTIKGVVSVRGFDARVGGRGAVFESHRPVAVIDQRGGSVSRHTIPAVSGGMPLLAVIAVPLAAGIVTRLLAPKRRRRRS